MHAETVRMSLSWQELSALLNRQAGLYVDTADLLFDLSRHTLVQAW